MRLFGLGKPQHKIGSQTTIGLTESGKKLVEQYESRGPTFALLAVLRERQPRSIGDIARESDMEIGDAKKRIKILVQQGYVRVMSTETIE